MSKSGSEISMNIPKIVFIVPYRNRPQHKFFFSNYLTSILNKNDKNDKHYDIYFSHQCDARSFNRGATKNIGFLAVKNKYPNDYQNITFVFNDVDTIPFSTSVAQLPRNPPSSMAEQLPYYGRSPRPSPPLGRTWQQRVQRWQQH